MLVDTASANDAVVANEAEVAFTTLFIVKGNVVASPLVNVTVALLIDAVRTLFNANDAVEANDADTAEPVATVRANVEPSPFVNVNTLLVALPVTINEPVFTVVAEPVATVTVNVEASPLVNVIMLLAAEAVVSKDAVDTVVPAFRAKLAVVANDELTAFNTYEAVVAVSAFDEVIAKLPVILSPKPFCSSLPLICVKNWKD
jgi:hypothetical protein